MLQRGTVTPKDVVKICGAIYELRCVNMTALWRLLSPFPQDTGRAKQDIKKMRVRTGMFAHSRVHTHTHARAQVNACVCAYARRSLLFLCSSVPLLALSYAYASTELQVGSWLIPFAIVLEDCQGSI